MLLLIGHQAVGKSSLGRAVAAHLGISFVDSDEALLSAHHERSIRSLWQRLGAEQFRQKEAEWIASYIEAPRDPTPVILALGAGAIETSSVRRLAQSFPTLLLRLPENILLQRQRARGFPAWALDALHPEQEVLTRQRYREALFQEIAPLEVTLSGDFSQDLVLMNQISDKALQEAQLRANS
jgi:shikimate kinase